jgi:hypothetical protein
MKKYTILLFAMLNLSLASTAQSVTQTVRFDTYVSSSNNDLVNNFSNTSWITQVTSGGITGGALAPPDSISWGNDKLNFCRNFFNIQDSAMDNSICFLYDASKVRPSAYQRAADIMLFSGVVNHYILFSVNYNHHLTILSYGSASDSLLSPLVSGHWYRLVTTLKSLASNGVFTKAEVFDLGTGGTGTPVSMGSNTSVFVDQDVNQSNFIDVSVSGAGFGGSALLDDYTFHGIPAANSCSPAGFADIPEPLHSYSCYPSPAHEKLVIKRQDGVDVEMEELRVYNALGELIVLDQKVRTPYTVEAGTWPGGMYILEIFSHGTVFRSKILKQ